MDEGVHEGRCVGGGNIDNFFFFFFFFKLPFSSPFKIIQRVRNFNR